jgi:hypothetical protein
LQILNAANEVIDSIDREELAKNFALKNDPDDEEAEVLISFSCAFSYPRTYLCITVVLYLFKIKGEKN